MNNLGYAEYYTETVLDVCMAKINVLKKLALKAENKELRKLRKYSDIRLYLKYKTTNLADIKIYTDEYNMLIEIAKLIEYVKTTHADVIYLSSDAVSLISAELYDKKVTR